MKWAINITALLISASVAYYATLYLAPNSILVFLKVRNGAEYNEPIFSDIISPKDREVPLPNPDFLYVVVPFDLGQGPIKVSGQMPDSTYYSVAFYAMNTRNFYIRNDRDTPKKEYSIVLAHGDDYKPPLNAEDEWVETPGRKGAILVRILITNESRIPYLQEIQRSFLVEAI